jgi:hypothetical protein
MHMKSPKSIPLTTKVSPEIIQMIESIAAEREWSLSHATKHLLKKGLEAYSGTSDGASVTMAHGKGVTAANATSSMRRSFRPSGQEQ